MAAAVPSAHKQVLDSIAHARSSPGDRVYTADLIREAIEVWLTEHADLPEEARDVLDDDLIANAGDTDGDGEPEVTEA